MNSPEFDDIREDFLSLSDWEERYALLIELGRQLPDFPDQARIEENRVHGCQSKVWLIPVATAPGLHFLADSDSLIVRGLIALLRALYIGRTPDEVLAIDESAAFAELGLDAHLSAGRRNGLGRLVDRIRSLAQALQAANQTGSAAAH
jgi:cysteine desulfuration protein SufE